MRRAIARRRSARWLRRFSKAVTPVAPSGGVLRRIAARITGGPVLLFLYLVSAGVLALLTVFAAGVWMSAALGRRG